jgi:hypothetical protein
VFGEFTANPPAAKLRIHDEACQVLPAPRHGKDLAESNEAPALYKAPGFRISKLNLLRKALRLDWESNLEARPLQTSLRGRNPTRNRGQISHVRNACSRFAAQSGG